MEAPERIEPPGLLLRRWTPEDAATQHATVIESFDHIHPWMPWAAEHPTIETQRAYTAESIERWEKGEAHEYGIFRDGEHIGTVGLMARIGPGAWEIGYWLHPAHTGQGIMTTAVRALTDLAFSDPGTSRVEIHCDAANAPSAAVPRRLSFELSETRERTPQAPAETGQELIWVRRRPWPVV